MSLGQLMSMEERIVLSGVMVADATDDSTDDDIATGAPAIGQPETAGKAAEASNANSGSTPKTTTGTTAQPNQESTPNNARSGEQTSASDMPDHGAQSELKALLVNTELENFQELVAGAAEDVLVYAYDGSRDSLQDILDGLREQMDGRLLDSIAFAVEGGSEGAFELTAGETVSWDTLSSEMEADQQEFFTALSRLMQENGRIDLLACDAAGGAKGDQLLQAIATITGREVAGSTDATGSAALGGDWVLEKSTDGTGVDLLSGYFTSDVMDRFDGILAAGEDFYIKDISYNFTGAGNHANRIAINFTYGNSGTVSGTDGAEILFYLTKNGNEIQDDDILIRTIELAPGNLKVDDEILDYQGIEIDLEELNGLNLDDYYIATKIVTKDTINAESNTENNEAFTSGKISLTPYTDLAVGDVDDGAVLYPKTAFSSGDTLGNVAVYIENGTGSMNGPAYIPADGESIRVEFYLSLSGARGSDNILLGFDEITSEFGGGFPGEARLLNQYFPNGVAAGSYHLLVVVDSQNSIAETNEGNNVWVSENADFLVQDSTPTNSAPVLVDHYTPTLNQQVSHEGSPSGTLVSNIIEDGSITDLDGVTKGMVVTSVDNTLGYWEYSLDGGTTWLRFTETTGGVVHLDTDPSAGNELLDLGKARLLDGSALIRFDQRTGTTGDVTFTFQAWDMSDGKSSGAIGDPTTNGGSTSFSSQYDEAVLTITTVGNQPPTADTIPNETFDQSGQFTYDVSGYFHDDAGDSLSYSYSCYNVATDQWENPDWLTMSSDGTLSGNPSVTDGGTLQITVTATDRAGNTVSAAPFNFVLGGNDSSSNAMNDAPQLTGRIDNTVYTSSSDQPIGAIGFSDPDLGDSHSYILGGSGKDMFTISNGRLILKAGAPADVYELVIGIMDSNGERDSRTVNITVVEAPPTPPAPPQNVDNAPKTEPAPVQPERPVEDQTAEMDKVYYGPTQEEARQIIEENRQEELDRRQEEERRQEREDAINERKNVADRMYYYQEKAENAVQNRNLSDFLVAYNSEHNPNNIEFVSEDNDRLTEYLLTITSEEFNNLISVGGGWLSGSAYSDDSQNISMLPPEIFYKLSPEVLLGIPANALTYMTSEQMAAMIDALNIYYGTLSAEQLANESIPAEMIVFLYVREITNGDAIPKRGSGKDVGLFLDVFRDSKNAQNPTRIQEDVATIINGGNLRGFEDVCNVYSTADAILAVIQEGVDNAVSGAMNVYDKATSVASSYGNINFLLSMGGDKSIDIKFAESIDEGLGIVYDNTIGKVIEFSIEKAVESSYNAMANPAKYIANIKSNAFYIAGRDIEDAYDIKNLLEK